MTGLSVWNDRFVSVGLPLKSGVSSKDVVQTDTHRDSATVTQHHISWSTTESSHRRQSDNKATDSKHIALF